MADEKRLDLIDRQALGIGRCNPDAFPLQSRGYVAGWNGVINLLEQAPRVDAVEVADMREFAKDVACQFGYYCKNNGRLHITHGGLSTLEWAFDILEWENPHPVPEFECEVTGCHEHATCGTQTADGYKRMCGTHFRKHSAKMDGDGNG